MSENTFFHLMLEALKALIFSGGHGKNGELKWKLRVMVLSAKCAAARTPVGE